MTGPTAERAIRVLNVDDDDSARFVKTEQLRRAGFHVVEAVTGADALLAADEAEFDVIILDIRLPDMNGFDLCRMFKDSPRTANIPVLQVSALLVEDQHRAEGLESGADSYLAAPFTPRVFLASVRALVRVRVAEAQLSEALERERQAREEAETATRLKDQFLATVSHELRTPLNTMAGWLWRLRQPGVTAAVLERGLASLERNAATQTRLIEDLLDVSRIVTGKLRLTIAPVDFGEVVRTGVEMLQGEADRKGVDLRVMLTDEDQVDGDAGRLQQVVVNLLSNALRYTPEGGSVEMRLDHSDTWLRLSVVDTGIGIEPEVLPHIFEPFRQAEPAPGRRNVGLGIGLAITRQIVTMHGGSVTARSGGLGAGATFVVTLPLASERRGTGGGERQAPGTLNDVRVLLVEDNDEARELTHAMLHAAGAQVTAMGSADEALAFCASAQVDVLVSDIGLPVMDGYALLQRLRAEGFEAPAVAVTAYATPADQGRAIAEGFSAHLAKPLEPRRLVEVVAQVIANGQSGR